MENKKLILTNAFVDLFPADENETTTTPIIAIEYAEENNANISNYLSKDKDVILDILSKTSDKLKTVYCIDVIYNLKKEGLLPDKFATKSKVINFVLSYNKNFLIDSGYDLTDILTTLNENGLAIKNIDIDYSEIFNLVKSIDNIPTYVINSGILASAVLEENKELKLLFTPNTLNKYQSENNTTISYEQWEEFSEFIRKKYCLNPFPFGDNVNEEIFYDWFKNEYEMLEMNKKFALLED